MTFVDTSGIYAFLNSDDLNHRRGGEFWAEALRRGDPLVTTGHTVLETCALVQRRLGLDVLRIVHRDIFPVLSVHWVDAALHEEGVSLALAVGRRDLSIVVCTAIALMRRLGIRDIFTFDPHFADQGFNVVP